MSSRELNSFFQKFPQLWNDGKSAHLDLDCSAGTAWAGLRVQLGQGHPPSPYHPSPHYRYRKSFSPSYQRRRERRAAERANPKHAEEASSNQTEKNQNAEEASNETQNNENAEEASVKENEIKQSDEKTSECENSVVIEAGAAEVSEKDDIIENTVAENMVNENKKERENGNEELCVAAASSETICQDIPLAAPEEIPVYCIATVENCPDSVVTEDYYQSIRRFLGSEQHLVQNISSAELQYISSRSFRNNLYTHTVSIVVHVRTARLWETPASYVRKHLGLTNYWTRSNGTIVRLSRIHQK